MSDFKKITVEIPRKNYDSIRKRVEFSEQKTSRILSKCLLTFFTILEDGELSIHQIFTREEARRLAEILNLAQKNDEISWEELCVFSGTRLGAVVELYAPEESVIARKISRLGSLEVLALVEYAQLVDFPTRFKQQTAKFLREKS